MFSLVYVSSAVQALSRSELLDILEKSRVNNKQWDITGMLLYKDGNIIQVLEGEERVVRALYTKIATDSRHYALLTLLQESIPERQFPAWSMGFHDLKQTDTLAIPGYNEFLNTPLTSQEFSSDPTRSRKLLALFKQKMR